MSRYVSERPIRTDNPDQVIKTFRTTFPTGIIKEEKTGPEELLANGRAYFSIEVHIDEQESLADWLELMNGGSPKKARRK